MLSSILTTKENMIWLRQANKYVEYNGSSDQGFYREFDYIVEMLNTKHRYQSACTKDTAAKSVPNAAIII